jgi:hypothetical protein
MSQQVHAEGEIDFFGAELENGLAVHDTSIIDQYGRDSKLAARKCQKR